MQQISLIAALAENHVIGRDNSLPWRLPADLQYFRRVTFGHPIVMGRKNYESIGRPLPGRTNIILTQQLDYQAPGCIVVHSLEAALAACGTDKEVFIIGGATLYAQTLPQATRLYLTLVHANVPGDTYFPDFDWTAWREIKREWHTADDKNAYAYSFVVLERK